MVLHLTAPYFVVLGKQHSILTGINFQFFLNVSCTITFFTASISAARSYYLNTRNSDKQTKIKISEFLTFVWLLSYKCHVCLSFAIKMRKMTKLRQKLQISHSDVIRALVLPGNREICHGKRIIELWRQLKDNKLVRHNALMSWLITAMLTFCATFRKINNLWSSIRESARNFVKRRRTYFHPTTNLINWNIYPAKFSVITHIACWTLFRRTNSKHVFPVPSFLNTLIIHEQ